MKRTAFHAASEAGHASIISALLANNVNFDAVDCEGQYTCFDIYPMELIHDPFNYISYSIFGFCIICKIWIFRVVIIMSS